MPLQNRVAPNSELCAVPERGTLMGNRGGRFHRDDQSLGKRRWASQHWICCELQFKDRHHEPMGQGYTSLFFLDEVTALAAGHRPCFECRRAEAKTFLAGRKVGEFDRQLHGERLNSFHPEKRHGDFEGRGDLPDGAMIQVGDQPFAIRGGQMLRWTFACYDAVLPLQKPSKVLTAPTITAILARGYQPRWPPPALQWDDT